jgi:hypothetical protein
MGLIDFILNLAGLLIWFNWRSMRFVSLRKAAPVSLAGTVKPAGSHSLQSWRLLAGLVVLLVLRAWLYCGLRIDAGWVPKLDLMVVVVPFHFRSVDQGGLYAALLFSVMSFGRLLVIFYTWLLALVIINRRTTEPDLILRVLRLHLGFVSRWPWPIQVLLPMMVLAGLWLALHPMLAYVGVVPPVPSRVLILEQGAAVSLWVYLTLRHLLVGILLLYLLSSYVYFGKSLFWDFVAATGRNLLAPLAPLRLCIGKVDLAPLAAAVLLVLVLYVLPAYGPSLTEQHHWLARFPLTLWPSN